MGSTVHGFDSLRELLAKASPARSGDERAGRAAFAPVAGLTVGAFRDWLLRYETDAATLAALAPGITPEMAAAVSKLMAHQDLVLVAKKCRVTTPSTASTAWLERVNL
jgi:ethanolamine ammonia-lyase large subunit